MRFLTQHLPVLLLAGLFSLVAAIGQAWAEDRALLIGVGKYRMASANLPGIDLDIDMMKEVAQLMGYSKSQIKVLMDQQATLAQVRQAMEDWLVTGVSAQDRVLIYYSGHGAQIPDENGDEKEDQVDEVLTMHDLKYAEYNGKSSLTGVLVDDDFQQLLKKIKSRNTLVLIDACHSGSSYKSVSLTSFRSGSKKAVEKFFSYPGSPPASKGFIPSKKSQAQGKDNFVFIAAAGDNEKSLATSRGSLFTLAIKESIEKASRANKNGIFSKDLLAQTSHYIQSHVEPGRLFHPQLSGNANKLLRIRNIRTGHGPVWRGLQDAVEKIGKLSLQANQTSFLEGDLLDFQVEVPNAGYLNVLVVDAEDATTVIFPNQYHPENKLSKGVHRIPGDLDFDLPAGAPFGPTLIVALFTQRNLNFFRDGEGKRNAKGELQDPFSALSAVSTRGFRAAPKVRGAAVMVQLCRERTQCR